MSKKSCAVYIASRHTKVDFFYIWYVKEKNKSDEEEDSDYVEPDAEPDQVATSPDSIRSPSVPLQSLNPLPPELIR